MLSLLMSYNWRIKPSLTLTNIINPFFLLIFTFIKWFLWLVTARCDSTKDQNIWIISRVLNVQWRQWKYKKSRFESGKFLDSCRTNWFNQTGTLEELFSFFRVFIPDVFVCAPVRRAAYLTGFNEKDKHTAGASSSVFPAHRVGSVRRPSSEITPQVSTLKNKTHTQLLSCLSEFHFCAAALTKGRSEKNNR